jgi:hypothetical protein
MRVSALRKDSFGRDQGGAGLRCLEPQAPLHGRLGEGELSAGIHPCQFLGWALDGTAGQTPPPGDGDDVGEIELARGICCAKGIEEAGQKPGRDRHHTRVAEADAALLLGGVLGLDDRLECPAGTG